MKNIITVAAVALATVLPSAVALAYSTSDHPLAHETVLQLRTHASHKQRPATSNATKRKRTAPDQSPAPVVEQTAPDTNTAPVAPSLPSVKKDPLSDANESGKITIVVTLDPKCKK